MNMSQKVVALMAISLATGAQAELQHMADAGMAGISGQSGLVIEAGIGSIDKSDLFGVDWSASGVTIEASKWEIDLQTWDSSTNDVDQSTALVNAGTGNVFKGGTISRDIAIAGQVDIYIDAVGDGTSLGAVLGGAALSDDMGGIGITLGNSDLNVRVGDSGFYLATGDVAGAQLSSFGAQEIIGINVDGLELVIRGSGL